MKFSLTKSVRLFVLLVGLCAATGAESAGDANGAAREAAAMTGGRVLDVQSSQSGGQTIFLVRVLLGDGRVKVVRVNGPAGTTGGR